jgi:hypothetical protein
MRLGSWLTKPTPRAARAADLGRDCAVAFVSIVPESGCCTRKSSSASTCGAVPHQGVDFPALRSKSTPLTLAPRRTLWRAIDLKERSSVRRRTFRFFLPVNRTYLLTFQFRRIGKSLTFSAVMGLRRHHPRRDEGPPGCTTPLPLEFAFCKALGHCAHLPSPMGAASRIRRCRPPQSALVFQPSNRFILPTPCRRYWRKCLLSRDAGAECSKWHERAVMRSQLPG